MAKHKLKILERFAELHHLGLKDWELRVKDRPFKVGDTVLFQIVDDNFRELTGREYERKIIYILDGFGCGLTEGYCIISISNN